MWKWDKGTIHHFFILKSLASEIPNLPIIKRASPCWLCLLDLLSLPICNIRASWDSTLSLLSKHTCPPGGIFQFCGLRYCYTFTTLKCVSRPRYFLELRIPLSTDYPKTLLRILIDMSDIVCPNWSHNSITLWRQERSTLFSVSGNIIHLFVSPKPFQSTLTPLSHPHPMSSTTSANSRGFIIRINPAADHPCHLLYTATLIQGSIMDLLGCTAGVLKPRLSVSNGPLSKRVTLPCSKPSTTLRVKVITK